MARARRLADFLGLKRSIVGLLTMVILVGMGEKMAERFLPIYLIALGGGAISVGLLNGLDNLLSALYSFPGGYLSDRLGTKRALLIFNLVAMLGFVIVILVPAWPAVIVGAAFFLSWTAISLPATMDLVAKVLPMNKRTMGVSLHSFVRRVPMALGPVVGGLCIDRWGTKDGVRIAFLAALAMGIIAAVAQQVLIEDDRSKQPTLKHIPRNPITVLRQMRPELRNLLISDILVRFCEQIPYAFVVIWAMRSIASPVSGTQFGILTTIEMVTAMLVYIPVAYLADRSHKRYGGVGGGVRGSVPLEDRPRGELPDGVRFRRPGDHMVCHPWARLEELTCAPARPWALPLWHRRPRLRPLIVVTR